MAASPALVSEGGEGGLPLPSEVDLTGPDHLTATLMPRFELQFPAREIKPLAARFGYEDNARLLNLGAAARGRGYYTRAEFIEVCAWKTQRSRPRIAANSQPAVRRLTGRSLAATDEPGRITPLLELEGVGVPTASTLLYFACPDDYPILDVRALESLGVRSRSTYPVSFWLEYLDACRTISRAHDVSLRTLDKALWQYSKEHSRPRRTSQHVEAPVDREQRIEDVVSLGVAHGLLADERGR
jgi:hypothetical protein